MSLVHPPTTGTRDIVLLRRGRGYVRLHVPPLLYVRSLSPQLQKALLALKGVRKVTVNVDLARFSVFYDPWITDDRPILLEIDRLATPLLPRMDPQQFQLALREQRRARLMRVGGKVGKGAYFVAIVGVHAWMFKYWVRRPLRYWWVWALVGAGVYIHRQQIRAIPKLS